MSDKDWLLLGVLVVGLPPIVLLVLAVDWVLAKAKKSLPGDHP